MIVYKKGDSQTGQANGTTEVGDSDTEWWCISACFRMCVCICVCVWEEGFEILRDCPVKLSVVQKTHCGFGLIWPQSRKFGES